MATGNSPATDQRELRLGFKPSAGTSETTVLFMDWLPQGLPCQLMQPQYLWISKGSIAVGHVFWRSIRGNVEYHNSHFDPVLFPGYIFSL